ATSLRVVNAESDFLSGLIVDKYEDLLVIQISSLGMDQRKAMIVAALQNIFSPRAVVERGEIASRKFEGLAEAGGVLAGELGARTALSASSSPAELADKAVRAPAVTVSLNGLKFEADLVSGHRPACISISRSTISAWRD